MIMGTKKKKPIAAEMRNNFKGVPPINTMLQLIGETKKKVKKLKMTPHGIYSSFFFSTFEKHNINH